MRLTKQESGEWSVLKLLTSVEPTGVDTTGVDTPVYMTIGESVGL